MPKVFLDLTNYDADRPTLRRLEKDLKKSPEFDKKAGRVFFFQFATEDSKMLFFATILRAITMTGWKGYVTYEHESNLINPSK